MHDPVAEIREKITGTCYKKNPVIPVFILPSFSLSLGVVFDLLYHRPEQEQVNLTICMSLFVSLLLFIV